MSGDDPVLPQSRQYAPDNDYMLQINNMMRAPAEVKNSLDEIMKSATALPAMSRVNNDNNAGACRKL
jgi:hypothetical protein